MKHGRDRSSACGQSNGRREGTVEAAHWSIETGAGTLARYTWMSSLPSVDIQLCWGCTSSGIGYASGEVRWIYHVTTASGLSGGAVLQIAGVHFSLAVLRSPRRSPRLPKTREASSPPPNVFMLATHHAATTPFSNTAHDVRRAYATPMIPISTYAIANPSTSLPRS